MAASECSTEVPTCLEKIQKISFFFSSTLLHVFDHFASKMNCKVPHFCKISIIVYIFDRFLCQRRFLQDLLWVSVCSAKFLVGSGGFLLWFFQKRNTSTFIRNIATEQVLMIFLCAQTWSEKFLEWFWPQKPQMLSKKMTLKKKKDFEVTVWTQEKFLIQTVDLL